MRIQLRALAVGAVLALATAMQAAPADATTMRPPGGREVCTYTVTEEGYRSTAICKNYNSHAIEFRAVVICGLAWDQTGPWVRLEPGKRGNSSALCSQLGSGVGGTSADIRDL